jgi:dTMP kinase
MFLSLDGGDGCGKSTQAALLAEALRERGKDVVTCRDPGSTELGEAVRNLLLHRAEFNITRECEMLLFMAARTQMVCEQILPAIASGKTVITDRFLLSTIVYQGYAGGVPVEMIEQVGKIATGGVLPDLTFVLDVSREVAEKRIGTRSKDRMEQMGAAYHEQVRQGFLTHAGTDPDRYIVLDASLPAETVASEILHRTLKFLHTPKSDLLTHVTQEPAK